MASETPRWTPYLLSGAITCPRRLLHEHEGRASDHDVFTRWRLRTPLVDAVSLAHASMRKATVADFPVPDDLLEEEEAVYRRAVDGYVALFGDVAARSVEHDDWAGATLLARRQVVVSGALDLVVETETGECDLRQFELGAGRADADPLSSWSMALAVLRIAKWAGARRVALRHANLLTRDAATHSFDFETDLAGVAQRFDDRRAALAAFIGPAAQPGVGCATCGHVAGCPAFPRHGR